MGAAVGSAREHGSQVAGARTEKSAVKQLRRYWRDRERGSIVSRRPSPTKLQAIATVKIASPGKVEIHHCCISSRPSATIAPHSGVGGTAPSPRKLSAAVMMIALPKSIVISTRIGATEFGSRWRNKIVPSGVPSARAAVTKSRDFKLSTCPRASRAYGGHQTASIASIEFWMLGPSAAAIAIARI